MPEEDAVTAPTPDAVTAEETAAAVETPTPTAEDISKLTQALEKERELRKGREKELNEFRNQAKASLTEAERSVLEAEQRGRTSAATEFGQRLARTEFIAEAAKRNPSFDATSILDDLNLARYIGEDGEPDSKAIANAAKRLIPEATAAAQPPSFDGGTRQAPPSGVSMSDLIRQAAGRA